MKASVQYNDKIGHASADIAGINYEQIAQRCNISERYTIVGISLYGTREISVSFFCIDNEESTPGNEVLVKVFPNRDLEVSSVLERLNVTINITDNARYDDPNLDTIREVTIDEDEDEDEDEN
ncbi:hypothetical protein [Flavobacterium hungaricum]|uniref:Uncharacterized protein n=1 Tax=Flavobacterium hungaricum TaxID=2082725 RepID=A0ABR9TL69_9FLAO|nr:hypothetical protein [Flavobacterium hungaricum]MBE8726120.1 hypothetical protein [Flavobacterium hungaricum]